MVTHIIAASLMAIPLAMFSKAGKRRWAFESLNASGKTRDADNEDFTRPFGREVLVERLYHVSSEGEWEQSFPLIEIDLKTGNCVELLITSESLTKKLEIFLKAQKSSQLRVLRLELMRKGPFAVRGSLLRWSKARSIVLCRYDFFPELLLLGLRARKSGGEFILNSATLINKPIAGTLNVKVLWYRWVYRLFSKMILASKREEKRFNELLIAQVPQTQAYDFRDRQILRRLAEREETLNLARLEGLMTWLGRTPKRHRLIMGSFWPSELHLLAGSAFCTWLQSSGIKIVIAPHLLEKTQLKKIAEQLSHLGHRAVVSDGYDEVGQEVTIVVLNKKGVLLELYPEFEAAYIGGGFGRSIHSVKEPFLGGCHVFVGPRVHRSTEWEDIEMKSPQQCTRFDTLEDFGMVYKSFLKTPPSFSSNNQQVFKQQLLLEEERAISCYQFVES